MIPWLCSILLVHFECSCFARDVQLAMVDEMTKSDDNKLPARQQIPQSGRHHELPVTDE